MTAPFRFSEDDWKKISEPLQNHLGLIVQDDYCVPARHLLEAVIDYWRLSDDGVCKRNEADCEEILQAIKKIRESDVGRVLIDSQFLGSLDALEKRCWLFLEDAEARFSRNDRRDRLIAELLIVWEDYYGGEAKTSTASDNKTPSGPLIRFLIAVMGSLGIELSPHAARKLVRNYREGKKRQTDVA
jgi:hypothetical protein